MNILRYIPNRNQISSQPFKNHTNLPTFQGATITASEQISLDTLSSNSKPANVVMITDPGFDVDDETAIVVGAALKKLGLADLKAVIATTIPSEGRALLAKGALKELGMGNVPVAIGSNHAPTQFDPQPQRLESTFNAQKTEVEADAQLLLKKTLEAAPDKSITLLVIANMSDAAIFLRGNEALFHQKIKNVVVMGGVNQISENEDIDSSGLKLSADGLLEANNIATNNRHHQESADFLYRRVQELEIPMTIVTRKAATNTPVSAEFFKDLSETGHPVANHIRGIEGDFLNKFWQAAFNNKMGPGRDKAWFISTMCKPETPNTINDQDDIRPYLKSRVLYDAIALLACVDGLSSQIFQPILIQTKNVTHKIIGLSQKSTGLVNPEKLATLLSALAKKALMTTNS
ncbi:MAG: nucleoside hydrolase [Cyanobacteria bacterium]|nr:nucleoside hydrolase [Cyanobacteriota bacterium]